MTNETQGLLANGSLVMPRTDNRPSREGERVSPGPLAYVPKPVSEVPSPKDADRHPILRVAPIAGIIRAVCDEFEISHNEITSARRGRFLANPRHVAFWLCRELTQASFPEIGRPFGGRDHTTVMHGCKKIDLRIEQNLPLGQRALALKAKLQAASDSSPVTLSGVSTASEILLGEG